MTCAYSESACHTHFHASSLSFLYLAHEHKAHADAYISRGHDEYILYPLFDADIMRAYAAAFTRPHIYIIAASLWMDIDFIISFFTIYAISYT